MRSISAAMEDGYNCMTDLMPTDPKKLVKLLSKIETELKEVKSENPEDLQKGKGQPDGSRSNKNRDSAKASHRLKGAIPRMSFPEKPKSYANCADNMLVLPTLIILLRARNGLPEAKTIKNGNAPKPPTSMSIKMLALTCIQLSWFSRALSKY